MSSDPGNKSDKSELSIPDSAKRSRRTPSLRTLIATLVFLAVAFYFIYPSLITLFSYLYPGNQHLSYPYSDGIDDRPPGDIDGKEDLPSRMKYGYDDGDSPNDIIPPFHPNKRFNLDYGKVACWQNRGVWIKKLTPVEMSALGVDRFQDTDRGNDQTEEDEFCARLRLYGASFWDLTSVCVNRLYPCWSIECEEPSKKVTLEVGFPTSGGIWVLDTSQEEEEGNPSSLRMLLGNALTMDERSEAIKRLGGVFCRDTPACAELDRLLKGTKPRKEICYFKEKDISDFNEVY